MFLFLSPAVQAVTLESTKSANLDIEARVPSRAEDILFDFKSSLTSQTVGAEQEITYTITYGSLLSYGTPMTIEAEWSLGTLPDSTLYSFNILSYVAGSATKDYWGESTPTVDLVNRKIRWVVTRFPPNTIGKTLSFKLKTPGIYVTDKNVNLSVRARLVERDTSKDWINLYHTYSPTEFIRSELKGLHILTADIRRITDSSFSIFLVTTEPTTAVLYYGLSPDNLDQTISDTTLSDQRLFTVDGLLPSTTYYFRILVENAKGIQRKTPEIFQVTTSSTSLLSLLDADRVVISSRGVLLSGTNGLGAGTAVVVPEHVVLDIFLPFKTSIPKDVSLSFTARNVLGITTDLDPITPGQNVRFLETQPGIFTGTIMTPSQSGEYDLTIEADGQLTGKNKDVITTVVVSRPVEVFDEKGVGIEHALVYLERFDSIKNAFSYFPASTYGSENPGYTDQTGSFTVVLPQGDYMINVNAPGYDTYQSRFTFVPNQRAPYPLITLKKASFAVTSYIAYYVAILRDMVHLINWNLDRFAASYRFLDASILTGVIILTVLSVATNLQRVRMSAEGFLIFIEKWMLKLFRKKSAETLYIAFVEDNRGLPVHGAVVTLVNTKAKSKFMRTVTNSLGKFEFQLDPAAQYDMTVKKDRYTTHRSTVWALTLLSAPTPIVLEHDSMLHIPKIIQFILMLGSSVFHALSDTLLFAVGILNVFLFLRLGVKVLPLMIITTANALLWLEYEWHIWRRANKEVS